jgi:hypothetical protein
MTSHLANILSILKTEMKSEINEFMPAGKVSFLKSNVVIKNDIKSGRPKFILEDRQNIKKKKCQIFLGPMKSHKKRHSNRPT